MPASTDWAEKQPARGSGGMQERLHNSNQIEQTVHLREFSSPPPRGSSLKKGNRYQPKRSRLGHTSCTQLRESALAAHDRQDPPTFAAAVWSPRTAVSMHRDVIY